jgi:GalNAc-alpha-(1->4)-GalNAc-alpha-(1->3)-diNAcBac-PP-undecaprenol alpha-1,4-N-acetyl-D-galactosaminyltransferase
MAEGGGTRVRPFRLTAVIGSLESGGAERIMALLTEAWVERGWDVVLLLTLANPAQEPFFAPDPRVEVRHLDLYRESRGFTDALASNLRRLRVLRKAIRASKPDAVLSFMTETSILTILGSLGLRIPVVVEEHIYSAWPPLQQPWRLLRLLTYPMAASVIALTPSALATLGLARGRRGRVVPNPVMPPPPGEVVPSEPPVIIAIGRLVPQKGFDTLLNAFARVARSHPDWRLEIWGEGPDRAALEQLRDALGISAQVSLPGRTREPYDVLRRASLFVMSSRREGFPTVLGEAMACGLPVVSFDCPSGPRELIRNGIDGLLIPPNDIGGLAAGIDRLITDRKLANDLASRAPEVVDRFALSTVLEQWDLVFADVTGQAIGTGTRQSGKAS